MTMGKDYRYVQYFNCDNNKTFKQKSFLVLPKMFEDYNS